MSEQDKGPKTHAMPQPLPMPPYNFQTPEHGGGSVATTCIEHQAGRQTMRLSFQIKVF